MPACFAVAPNTSGTLPVQAQHSDNILQQYYLQRQKYQKAYKRTIATRSSRVPSGVQSARPPARLAAARLCLSKYHRDIWQVTTGTVILEPVSDTRLRAGYGVDKRQDGAGGRG